MREKLLITGAAGGMGRACARLLGLTHDLILADLSPSLEGFAEELTMDGYTVRGTLTGDLGDDALLADIAAQLSDGAPFSLVHTAGISPSMAGWRPILEVNLRNTEKLLGVLDSLVMPGCAAVLIASIAAHAPFDAPDMSAMLVDPLAAGCLDRLGAIIEDKVPTPGAAQSALAYVVAKKGVRFMAEKRSLCWGRKGARIVSISPGLILTPMGRLEVDASPGTRDLGESAPAGRLGNALDIAKAARFLLSEDASFITGCDLLVDGGSVGSRRWP